MMGEGVNEKMSKRVRGAYVRVSETEMVSNILIDGVRKWKGWGDWVGD